MPTGLPSEFTNLEQQLRVLRERYSRGELTTEAYQQAVQALTVQDASGTTWWLGGEPGAWQRWDGRQWVRDTPPADVPAVPAQFPTSGKVAGGRC